MTMGTLIAVWIASAIVCPILAKIKGHGFWMWLVIGIVCGAPALAYCMFMPEAVSEDSVPRGAPWFPKPDNMSDSTYEKIQMRDREITRKNGCYVYLGKPFGSFEAVMKWIASV